ncbi:putative reverse transcriptase domain-containing protein [Tanacetum coccineum]
MEYGYHPKTDRQSERTIQRMENWLRDCVMDVVAWDTHLPLIEFLIITVYNRAIKVCTIRGSVRAEMYLKEGSGTIDKNGNACTTICGDHLKVGSVLTGGLSAEVTPGAKLCPRHISCVEPQEMLG